MIASRVAKLLFLMLAVSRRFGDCAFAQSTPRDVEPVIISSNSSSPLSVPAHPASLKRVSPKDIAERGVERQPKLSADTQATDLESDLLLESEPAYEFGGATIWDSSKNFRGGVDTERFISRYLPTIFTMPTYPDPAGGAIFEWSAGDAWQWRGGIFDGVGATGVPTGSRLPTTLLDNFDDLFGIAEVDYTWGTRDQGTLGRLAFGGWGHHGNFDRFDGGIKHGTGGWYVATDQWLWNEGSCEAHCEQGIAAFFQFGSANPAVSQAERHWGGGLVWTGAFPKRDSDLLGIGVTGVEFSPQSNELTAAREVSTEVFYEWTGWEKWLCTIDLQYISNPGGYAEHREAIVSTVRLLRQF